eukprot:TRINITY_DN2136_c0_g1_i1.p1 TRINITY_DN2136_c0_g1~~TRINITY_DN2136_c0_g1_i1.p1  ORF type:complete len:545 (-),score=144.94 TRINITY_DN2136_c0_g1_i1:84-1718(-)
MTTQIKRKAEIQLNPDNVDQIDKFEPSGSFEKADPSVLQTRTYYRIPKNDSPDDNDFFDDDSDIVLDDDFAAPPKSSSPVNDPITKDVSKPVSVSNDNKNQDASGSLKQSTKNADSEVSVSKGEQQKSTPETGVTKPSFGIPKPGSITKNPSTESKPSLTGSGTFASFTDHSEPDSPKTNNVFGFGVQKKDSGQGLSSSGSFSSFKQNDAPTQTSQQFGFSRFGKHTEKKESEATPQSKDTKSEKSPSPFAGSFGVAQKTFAGLKQQSKEEEKKTSPFSSFAKSTTSTTDSNINTKEEVKPKENNTIKFGFSATSNNSSGDGEQKSAGFGGFGGFGLGGDKKSTGFSGFGSGEKKGFGFSGGSEGEKKIGFGFGGFGSSTNSGFGDVKSDGKSFTSDNSNTNTDSENVTTIGEKPEPKLQKPDQPTSTGEEEESTIFENRARLYKFEEQYKPVGRGSLKLNKHQSENKYRFLLRTEGGLKLVFNAALFKGFVVKKLDPRSMSISAINFCDPESQLSTYLIRLENEDICHELFTATEQALKNISA